MGYFPDVFIVKCVSGMRCIYLYFLPITITECGSIGLLSSTDYQSDADYLSGTFLSSKMSGNRITIHQFVLALVTALVLCAVCVGGVSGAVFDNVHTEIDLREAVDAANENDEDDTIIIRDNIVLTQSSSIEISNGQITIQSEAGKSYTISRAASSYSDKLNFILFQVEIYSPIFTVTNCLGSWT